MAEKFITQGDATMEESNRQEERQEHLSYDAMTSVGTPQIKF